MQAITLPDSFHFAHEGEQDIQTVTGLEASPSWRGRTGGEEGVIA